MTIRTSGLTDRERSVLAGDLVDLAVGYPELALPAWQHELWYEMTLQDLAAVFRTEFPHIDAPAFESLPSSYVLEREFVAAARRVLGLPHATNTFAFPTGSGSLALAYAIEAAVPRGAHAATQLPGFDVIRLLLAERGAAVSHIPMDWVACHFAPNALVADAPRGPAAAIVLVSPDNPTGAILDEALFLTLQEAQLIGPGTVIVVDQAFSLIAPQELRGSATTADLLESLGNPWILVWDTGKTFDLDDEKLGLVLTNDEQLARGLEAIILRYQCTLPRRTLMMLTLLLRRSGPACYLDWLWELRESNVLQLSKELAPIDRCTLTVGPTGGFALVESRRHAAGELVDMAANKRLGLVSTASFVEDPADPRGGLLRVPLLRRPEMMRHSAQILGELIRK